MGVELYLSILLCSVICTILLTESLKNLLNSTGIPYRTNVIVLDSAMVSSTATSLLFKTFLNLGLSFSLEQIVRLLLVVLSVWFVSMIVYDKAVQTKEQYKKYKEERKK